HGGEEGEAVPRAKPDAQARHSDRGARDPAEERPRHQSRGAGVVQLLAGEFPFAGGGWTLGPARPARGRPIHLRAERNALRYPLNCLASATPSTFVLST